MWRDDQVAVAALKRRSYRAERDFANRVRLNPARDPELLANLAWARYLTTTQLCRLHFPSQRMAQRRMRGLLDLGLVRAVTRELHLDGVHLITRTGLDLLMDLGAIREGEFAPGRLPRPQKLTHALAVRDVFVAALEVERAGTFEVVDFRFDEDLARAEPFHGAGLIPDGLARLKVGPLERAVGIEVDLGTETTAMLNSKFSRWTRLLPPSHGAPVARLLVFAATARRRDTLAALLAEAGLGAVAGAYLLTECRTALEGFARTFDLYAPPVRSERTAPEPSGSPIQPQSNEQPIFRVRSRT